MPKRPPVDRSARALGGAGIALIALMAIGIWLRFRPVPWIDLYARSWATDHQVDSLGEALRPLIRLGGWVPVACLVMVVALVQSWRARGPRPLFAAATSLLVAAVITLVLKVLLARPGPTGVTPLRHDGAWPSGHTVALTVGTVVVWHWIGQGHGSGASIVRWSMPFLPPVLSAAMVYRGDHWVTDVVAGLLLGYATARVAVVTAGTPDQLVTREPLDRRWPPNR